MCVCACLSLSLFLSLCLCLSLSLSLSLLTISLTVGNSRHITWACQRTNYMRLQQVQNTAARIFIRTKRSDRITPSLRELHWLPIEMRIDYKMLSLVVQLRERHNPPPPPPPPPPSGTNISPPSSGQQYVVCGPQSIFVFASLVFHKERTKNSSESEYFVMLHVNWNCSLITLREHNSEEMVFFCFCFLFLFCF